MWGGWGGGGVNEDDIIVYHQIHLNYMKVDRDVDRGSTRLTIAFVISAISA